MPPPPKKKIVVAISTFSDDTLEYHTLFKKLPVCLFEKNLRQGVENLVSLNFCSALPYFRMNILNNHVDLLRNYCMPWWPLSFLYCIIFRLSLKRKALKIKKKQTKNQTIQLIWNISSLKNRLGIKRQIF